jgi:hypothetical protein
MAGGMKLFTPHDALAAQMAWVSHFPAFAPKLIGLLEVLGGLGCIYCYGKKQTSSHSRKINHYPKVSIL